MVELILIYFIHSLQLRSNKQNNIANNNKQKHFEQKNPVFHFRYNRTAECHPSLNPKKIRLNFDMVI